MMTMIDDDCMKLRAELVDEFVFLHLELFDWSKELYKAFKETFSDIKTVLSDSGYEDVWIFIPNDDEKLLKFERMFGFEIVGYCADNYLMWQEV